MKSKKYHGQYKTEDDCRCRADGVGRVNINVQKLN